MKYQEIIWPLSVEGGRNDLSTFFLKMSGEVQGAECRAVSVTQVQENVWWSSVMHKQTS